MYTDREGTYANMMRLDVETLDGSETYGPTQEAIMDAVAKTFNECLAEGLRVRFVLSDSMNDTVLDLDGLDYILPGTAVSA